MRAACRIYRAVGHPILHLAPIMAVSRRTVAFHKPAFLTMDRLLDTAITGLPSTGACGHRRVGDS